MSNRRYSFTRSRVLERLLQVVTGGHRRETVGDWV
jgi:hypothetical protein